MVMHGYEMLKSTKDLVRLCLSKLVCFLVLTCHVCFDLCEKK